MPIRGILIALAISVLCLPVTGTAQTPAAPSARFLYLWTGDADRKDTDFLAIVDVDESSPTYAQVIRTIPAGASGLYPHHTEQFLSGTEFFANGYTHRTLIWDASDPLAPRPVGELDHPDELHHAHSFLRLPDGTVLSTHQYGPDGVAGKPGGLVLYDRRGRVIRSASSADPAFPGAAIRTYSLDASPRSGLAVTVSSPMDDERTADVFQVWRVDDLTLLKTVQLAPESDSAEAYPFEVRFLRDGRSALLNTYYCGLYLLRDLDTDSPGVRLVHRFATEHGNRGCGVPLLVGSFWIMPVAEGRAVVVLDVADPEHPREVARLETDPGTRPHWLSADRGSDRLVLIDQGDESKRIFLLRFDPATGALRFDERFREPGSSRNGIDFARDAWPHGASGPAVPHGSFFVP